MPLAAGAQQAAKVYRIAVLCPTQCVSTHPLWPHVIQGLRDFGWVEGLNFVFELRHAHGQPERLPGLAKELVGMKPDVLQAPSHAAAQALMDATRTIPIIFVGVVDPVQSGFVKRGSDWLIIIHRNARSRHSKAVHFLCSMTSNTAISRRRISVVQSTPGRPHWAGSEGTYKGTNC